MCQNNSAFSLLHQKEEHNSVFQRYTSVRRTPPVKGLEKTFNVQKIPPSGKFQNFFLIIKENSMPNLGSKKRVEHSGRT